MAITWYNPNMTGPNTPAPYVASSNRAVYGIYAPWRAFQQIVPTVFTQGDSWTPGQGITSGWIQIDMGQPTLVTDYKMRVRGDNSQPGYEPYTGMARNWTLQGSNDGINFTIIDTRTNVNNWSASVIWQEWHLAEAVRYRYYRVDVTASNGASWLIIGKIQFGATVGRVLFQNTTTNKFYTVSGNSAVEVADGSFATADTSGIAMGTKLIVSSIPNFKSSIGLPFNVLNYTSAGTNPVVKLVENFTGRLSARSIPISLVGIKDLVSITAVSTGSVLHALSFDGGITMLRFDGTQWVEVLNASEGMTTAELNALTMEQLNLVRTGVRLATTSMVIAHSLPANATLTSITLKVNLEGETRLAPQSSYTQTFNQGLRTITFNITKSGQYSINYVDSL